MPRRTALVVWEVDWDLEGLAKVPVELPVRGTTPMSLRMLPMRMV
jgi:hypothetical protein